MKAYVKPELFYESFELSQHIALCDYQLNLTDATNCKIITDRYEDDCADVVGGFTSKNVCDFQYEIYCYTNGSGSGPKIFQS